MAKEKQNGDLIPFLKQKDYIMVNNNLGSGSFGKTVLLQDPFIDELFVCKKYEPEFEDIKELFYKNFLAEIKMMYKLNHPNIVRIYNYYAYEDACTGYILMEYIDGKNIGDFFSEYFPPFESISLDNVFIQLIDAFCYMESCGIIHRDIREGNILIDNNGTVKVIDFGIGKVFSKPEEATDSLVDDIFRGASDTLPQEYYDGVYTNLTDMFYLAELLHRLINNSENCSWDIFSYKDILDKMMEKHPENRFESFSAVKEAIGKHDFINMDISGKDKKIYQAFTNSIYESIISYNTSPTFHTDPTVFISKLENSLKSNVFEDVIQHNPDVINCIVNCGYTYKKSARIPCELVKNFLSWFKSATQQSQALILNNFISKLAKIKIELSDDDLPF